MPSLPPEELRVSSFPRSLPRQALSPPACSASEGCTRVTRSPVTSGFCPASVHWMFSSHFLPLLKLLEQSGAASQSQTSGGQAAKSTWASLDGAAGHNRFQPRQGRCCLSPGPGAHSSRGAKPPVISGRLCHPVPAQPVLSNSDRAVMLTSHHGVWLCAAVLVTAGRPGSSSHSPLN